MRTYFLCIFILLLCVCALHADNAGKNAAIKRGTIKNFNISPSAVQVAGLSGVTAIAAGQIHTCALLSSGAVKCWGNNGSGELGTGSASGPETCGGSSSGFSCSTTPVDVTGLTDAVSIAAGSTSSHTCVITSSKKAMCWGDNTYGQLGNGTMTDSATPVEVTGLNGNTETISVGGSHTCALLSSGGVKCWGKNDYGQLGTWDGMSECDESSGEISMGAGGCSAVPVGVEQLGSFVKGINNGKGKEIGSGNEFEKDDGQFTSRGEVVALSAGDEHTCALLASGNVKCWGHYDYLGMGTGYGVEDLLVECGLSYCSAIPRKVTNMSDATALSAGMSHTCALTSSREIQCWGSNSFGQRGNTDAGAYEPAEVEGLKDEITAIGAGMFHTCAVTSSGGIKCWGSNFGGTLGDGMTSGHDGDCSHDCSMTPVSVETFGIFDIFR